MRANVVVIIGPSASGKTSVGMGVANRLGVPFLSTGKLYRAVTVIGVRSSEESGQPPLDLLERLDAATIEYTNDQRVLIDGEDVTALLETERVTKNTPVIAKIPEIRERVTRLTHLIVETHGGCVVEGRDSQELFPEAIAFYLDASPRARAERQFKRFEQLGTSHGSVDEIEQDIAARDHTDRTRSVAPLVVPETAIVIDSTTMSLEEVVTNIERMALGKISLSA